MLQIILKYKEHQIKYGCNHRESEILNSVLKMQAYILRSHLLDGPVTIKKKEAVYLSISIPKGTVTYMVKNCRGK